MRPSSCLILVGALVVGAITSGAEATGRGSGRAPGILGAFRYPAVRNPFRLGQFRYHPNRFGRLGQFAPFPGIVDGYGLAGLGTGGFASGFGYDGFGYGGYGSYGGAGYGRSGCGYGRSGYGGYRGSGDGGFGGYGGCGGYPFTFGRYAYDAPGLGYGAASSGGVVVVTNQTATGIPAPAVLPPAVYVIDTDRPGRQSSRTGASGVRVVNLMAAAGQGGDVRTR